MATKKEAKKYMATDEIEYPNRNYLAEYLVVFEDEDKCENEIGEKNEK